MLFENNCIEAELLNGDMVDIYFDFNYTAGLPGNISCPPENCWPEEYEEYEIFNIKVDNEYAMSELTELSTENEFYVMGCLEEHAIEVYEEWVEGREENNAEDRQDLMNIMGGLKS